MPASDAQRSRQSAARSGIAIGGPSAGLIWQRMMIISM